MMPANSTFPDDLAIGVVIDGPPGRTALAAAEVFLGRCAVQTAGGLAWAGSRRADIEIRVFNGPQPLVEALLVGGVRLAEGLSVTVMDPDAPTFAACGPGRDFLGLAAGWPDFPPGWASAIVLTLNRLDEGAIHARYLH